MSKYKTTLRRIESYDPCEAGWFKLLKHLNKIEADDEDLDIKTILESNGVSDAIWALRALTEEYITDIKLLICDIAETNLEYVKDKRVKEYVDVVRKYIHGQASLEELKTACIDACVAASYIYDYDTDVAYTIAFATTTATTTTAYEVYTISQYRALGKVKEAFINWLKG